MHRKFIIIEKQKIYGVSNYDTKSIKEQQKKNIHIISIFRTRSIHISSMNIKKNSP